MNQLNSSEELDSSKTFYPSFWNFELERTLSVKKFPTFSFSPKKNIIHMYFEKIPLKHSNASSHAFYYLIKMLEKCKHASSLEDLSI